jgi:hypothetical protein
MTVLIPFLPFLETRFKSYALQVKRLPSELMAVMVIGEVGKPDVAKQVPAPPGIVTSVRMFGAKGWLIVQRTLLAPQTNTIVLKVTGEVP